MPKITFTFDAEASRTIDADTGSSIMEAAVANEIPGIDADCGGACACATCHIIIDEAFFAKVGPADEMEQSMLDFSEGVEERSRLGCQIPMRDDLDGLVVKVPSE